MSSSNIDTNINFNNYDVNDENNSSNTALGSNQEPKTSAEFDKDFPVGSKERLQMLALLQQLGIDPSTLTTQGIVDEIHQTLENLDSDAKNLAGNSAPNKDNQTNMAGIIKNDLNAIITQLTSGGLKPKSLSPIALINILLGHADGTATSTVNPDMVNTDINSISIFFTSHNLSIL